MKIKTSFPSVEFADLTWDYLKDWAGAKIVSRGKSYQSQVEQPCVTDGGGLAAWVLGTERYATQAWFLDDDLVSICTCPYDWGPCKHAVALVLVGIDALKNQKGLPLVTEEDERLEAIAAFLDEEDEIYEDTEFVHDALQMESSVGSGVNRTPKQIRDALKSMKKQELIELILDLTRQHPEIIVSIQERQSLISGDAAQMVKSIRKQIRELTSEPAWRNHYRGYGEVPDYSPLQRRMENLLGSGHYDQLVDLGLELWQKGNRQVEQSDDDGETARQIARCMEVVLRALQNSSIPKQEQLVWQIDLALSDEFGMLDSDYCESVLKGFQDKDWNCAADVLLERLESGTTPSNEHDFSSRYHRGQVTYWLLRALKKSGRQNEIIPFLKRETTISDCYETLVEHLLTAGREHEAREWAVRGFEVTCDSYSGIAWDLERVLRSMAEKSGDHPLAASYRALEFFHEPGLDSYLKLQKAAENCRLWDEIRPAALLYLESGARPDLAPPKQPKGVEARPSLVWPLPKLPITWQPEHGRKGYFPQYSELIKIAIHEKRHDDAITWYEASAKRDWWIDNIGDYVAQAIQETHPEVSLGIWKNIAETHIDLVKTKAYLAASGHLEKMRRVYRNLGKIDQWNEYIDGLRKKHWRKRRLMEVLDELESLATGGRIIDQD